MGKTTKEDNYDAFNQAFGAAVRQLRAKAGVSQENLANIANIDRSYMGAIERGTKNVTIKNICKIAKALEKNPSELFKLTEKLLGEAT